MSGKPQGGSPKPGGKAAAQILPSAVEEQIWLSASQQILSQAGAGQAMHYTEIKRQILEKNLVGPGLQTTLEAALCNDTHTNRKVVVVPRKPGYFQLAENMMTTTTPTKPVVSTLPSTSTQAQVMPKIIRIPTPGASPQGRQGQVIGTKIKVSPGPKSPGQSTVTSGIKSPGHAILIRSPSGQTLVHNPQSTVVAKSPVFTTAKVQGQVLRGQAPGQPQFIIKGQGHRKIFLQGAQQGSENGNSNAKYEKKYKRLKKVVKDMIFLNAAVCDEAVRIDEKVALVKEERRYLLKRLLQQQALSEVITQALGKQAAPSNIKPSSQSIAQILGEIEKKSKKKTTVVTPKSKIVKQDDGSKPKSKKMKNLKRLVQPIPLDNSGRPVFPIDLGHLTVYCLGDVSSDRIGFHSTDAIYPTGFYSTRMYISIDPTQTPCLYNCKILDTGIGPKFEIASEGTDHLFTGSTASECHNKLLQALNASRSTELIPLGDKGSDFFGFTHPTIQNLIQSLPGARKCNRYKWVKFEVNRDGLFYTEDDIAVNLDALGKFLDDQKEEPQPMKTSGNTLPANLRSLLTVNSS